MEDTIAYTVNFNYNRNLESGILRDLYKNKNSKLRNKIAVYWNFPAGSVFPDKIYDPL